MDLLAGPFVIGGLTFVLAALTGRLWVVLLPAIFWPLYFTGMNAGWWGPDHSTEGWVLAFLWELLMATVAVALGLLLHRAVLRARQQ